MTLRVYKNKKSKTPLPKHLVVSRVFLDAKEKWLKELFTYSHQILGSIKVPESFSCEAREESTGWLFRFHVGDGKTLRCLSIIISFTNGSKIESYEGNSKPVSCPTGYHTDEQITWINAKFIELERQSREASK